MNLARGAAYVGSRTGEGQAAGADGRRAQTGCGRGYGARAAAGKPKSRRHAMGVAYGGGRTGGRLHAIPPQSSVTACLYEMTDCLFGCDIYTYDQSQF